MKILVQQPSSSGVVDVIQAAVPLIAPVLERISSPIAQGLDLGATVVQHFAEAAAEEGGRQIISRMFGLLDRDSTGAVLSDSLGTTEWASVDEGNVFFEFEGAVVPISGQLEIQRLHAGADPGASLWILIGSTDRSGPEVSNRTLAAERVDAVAEFLLARDVSPFQIIRKPISERGTPLPAMDGQKDPANRLTHIVLIQFGRFEN